MEKHCHDIENPGHMLHVSISNDVFGLSHSSIVLYAMMSFMLLVRKRAMLFPTFWVRSKMEVCLLELGCQ